MNTITIPTKPQLTTEVFSIPLEINRYIVYAPLKRVAFIANASMVNFIADLQVGYYDKEDDRQNVLINFLRQIQLIDSGADNYPITEFHGLPKPTAVSLFLTTACNLRCTYCYASSGETPARHMSIETARHGIDFISICKVKTPAFRRVDFICSPHADRVAERVSTGHRGQDGLSVWEPHGLQD